MRETCVFFQRAFQVIEAWHPSSATSQDVDGELHRHEMHLEPHSVDFDEVRSRMLAGSSDVPEFLQEGAEEKAWTLDQLSPHFRDLGDVVTRWDFITCAARLIEYNRLGENALISTKPMPQIVAKWTTYDFRANHDKYVSATGV
jgi:hypothetical protein